MATESPSPEAYRTRVMLNVLNAVVAAGEIEGSEESMVELRAAIAGVCDAIAMLVAASGQDRTQKHRRETADMCRSAILVAANGIAAKVAAGEPLPWTLDSLPEPN